MKLIDIFEKDEKVEAIANKKDCSFEENIFLMEKGYNSDYNIRFGNWTGTIDMLLAIYYNIKFHPIGWSLFGNFYYGYFGFMFFAFGISYESKLEGLSGWGNLNKSQCRKNYFIQSYATKQELEKAEINFYKILLYYEKYSEIPEIKQRLTEFQKEFLQNNKVEIYIKHNYFYRYIYYPGGKKTFEEDFKKYLYLTSN